MMNQIFENIFWFQKFSIFETFGQPHIMRNDSLAMFFPYEVKCTMEYLSVNGNPQSAEFMCFLNHNVLYEKAAIFIWFWMAFVLLLTTGNLFIHSYYHNGARKSKKSRPKKSS